MNYHYQAFCYENSSSGSYTSETISKSFLLDWCVVLVYSEDIYVDWVSFDVT